MSPMGMDGSKANSNTSSIIANGGGEANSNIDPSGGGG